MIQFCHETKLPKRGSPYQKSWRSQIAAVKVITYLRSDANGIYMWFCLKIPCFIPIFQFFKRQKWAKFLNFGRWTTHWKAEELLACPRHPAVHADRLRIWSVTESGSATGVEGVVFSPRPLHQMNKMHPMRFSILWNLVDTIPSLSWVGVLRLLLAQCFC